MAGRRYILKLNGVTMSFRSKVDAIYTVAINLYSEQHHAWCAERLARWRLLDDGTEYKSPSNDNYVKMHTQLFNLRWGKVSRPDSFKFTCAETGNVWEIERIS
jgi:hypothetical protein